MPMPDASTVTAIRACPRCGTQSTIPLNPPLPADPQLPPCARCHCPASHPRWHLRWTQQRNDSTVSLTDKQYRQLARRTCAHQEPLP